MGARIAAHFTRGTIGNFWRALGRYTEGVVRTILNLNPRLNLIVRNFNTVGKRSVDFYLKSKDGLSALLEVKYTLARAGTTSFTRMINQLNAAVQTGQGQVVLWSLREPPIVAVEEALIALGPNAARVQFVHGVEGLYKWMQFFFGAF